MTRDEQQQMSAAIFEALEMDSTGRRRAEAAVCKWTRERMGMTHPYWQDEEHCKWKGHYAGGRNGGFLLGFTRAFREKHLPKDGLTSKDLHALSCVLFDRETNKEVPTKMYVAYEHDGHRDSVNGEDWNWIEVDTLMSYFYGCHHCPCHRKNDAHHQGGFSYLQVDDFMVAWWQAMADLKGRGERPQLLMKRQDDDKFFEMPNEDDGGSYSYRTAEDDRRPKYEIKKPEPLPPYEPCDVPREPGTKCPRRKGHEGECQVRQIHKAPALKEEPCAKPPSAASATDP